MKKPTITLPPEPTSLPTEFACGYLPYNFITPFILAFFISTDLLK